MQLLRSAEAAKPNWGMFGGAGEEACVRILRVFKKHLHNDPSCVLTSQIWKLPQLTSGGGPTGERIPKPKFVEEVRVESIQRAFIEHILGVIKNGAFGKLTLMHKVWMSEVAAVVFCITWRGR